jgi:hypothetical protein
MPTIAPIRTFVATQGGNPWAPIGKVEKVTAAQDYGRPSVEALHLIHKLRWMGMEEDAERLQMKVRDTTPAGGIITTTRETD